MSVGLRRPEPWLDAALDWADDLHVVRRSGVGAGQTAWVVGGTGDVALALALAGARVHTTVASESSAALVALKRATALLHHAEALQVLGLRDRGRRVYLYRSVREALPAWARDVFDPRESAVREGLWRSGVAERSLLRGFAALRAVGVSERHGIRRASLLGGWLVGGSEGRVSAADRRVTGARLAEALARGPQQDGWLALLLGLGLVEPTAGPAFLTPEGHRALGGVAVDVEVGDLDARLAAAQASSFDVVVVHAAATESRRAHASRAARRVTLWRGGVGEAGDRTFAVAPWITTAARTPAEATTRRSAPSRPAPGSRDR